MSERTSYTPGTPSWVDLGSPDTEASARFYGELFGWEVTDEGPPETGGYRMFTLGGKLLGGLMKLQADQQPPAWGNYVSVADADATAEAVAKAGGSVLMGPHDVLDSGRMAFFSDAGGAVFGVWQPKNHPGAGLVNEPGALTWNELTSRDTEGAKAFYSAVFGWESEDADMGGMQYTTWSLDGGPIGGMMETPPEVPAEVPSYWMPYFGVPDTDAAVARIEELGGKVVVPATDIPSGRFAIATDPQGAMFGVVAMAEWSK
jgi:predicted enzyme related to lactoylglutathione lyase